MNLLQIILECQTRGIALSLKDGQLKLVAADGALDDALLGALKAHKSELITWLADNAELTSLSSAAPFDSAVSFGSAVPFDAAKASLEAAAPRPSTSMPVLSAAQKGMWLAGQMGHNPAQFNIPFTLQLSGDLQTEALAQSLRQLLAKHQVLRTAITEQNGEPTPTLLSELDFELAYQDMTAATQQDIDAQIQALSAQAFDLSKDYTLRANLLQIADDKHLLVIVLHHIATDGWSNAIIVKDLCGFYQRVVEQQTLANQSGSSSEMGLQYADFAARQQAWLNSTAADVALSYWEQYLKGAPSCHSLPLDASRPAASEYQGAHLVSTLPVPLALKLKQFASTQGCTLFNVLKTAFALSLGRWSEQSDVVLGLPIACRDSEALQSIVGMIMNTQLFRLTIDETQSFAELVALAQKESEHAELFKSYPFESLVERVVTERQDHINPLYQIMISMHNYEQANIALSGLDVTLLDRQFDAAKVDIILNVMEKDGALALEWQYNSAILNQSTMVFLDRFFAQFLGNLLQQPERAIAQIDANDFATRLAIVNEHGQGKHTKLGGDFSTAQAAKTLIQGILTSAKNTPDAVALLYKSANPNLSQAPVSSQTGNPNTRLATHSKGALTYLELAQQIQAFSAVLQEKGVKKGDVVCVCVTREGSLPVVLLSLQLIGATYVPIDVESPISRQLTVAEQSGSRFFIGHDAQQEQEQEQEQEASHGQSANQENGANQENRVSQEGNAHARKVQSGLNSVQNASALWDFMAIELLVEQASAHLRLSQAPEPSTSSQSWLDIHDFIDAQLNAIEAALTHDENAVLNALAYIMFTSGSTGKPKGVSITQKGLMNYLRHAVECYLPDVSGSVVSSSIAFDATITAMYSPLLAGKSVNILPQGNELADIEATLQQASQAQLFKLTPAHLESVSLDHLTQALQHVFVIGGAQLLQAQLDKWQQAFPNATFINEYGPTETVVGCSIWHSKHSQPGNGHAVPIGQALPNYQLYVVDHQNRLAPLGAQGELLIGGDSVSPGYVGQPALTAERFIRSEQVQGLGIPHQHLYRTGDWVRWNAHGDLVFIGRCDHQIELNGYRIEPGEIEQLLLASGKAEQATVFKADFGQSGNALACAVVSSESAEAITAFLQDNLPKYMVPTRLSVLKDIPLTVNGKVDHDAIQAQWQYSAQAKDETPSASLDVAMSPKEEAFLEIWQAVLGKEDIGVNDNFFGVSGDSIRALQIVAKSKQKGIDVTLADLYQKGTIRAIVGDDSVQPEGSDKTNSEQTSSKQKVTAQKGAQQAQTQASAETGSQNVGDIALAPIQQWFFDRDLPDNARFLQSLCVRVDKAMTQAQIKQVTRYWLAENDSLRTQYRSGAASVIAMEESLVEAAFTSQVLTGDETKVKTQLIEHCQAAEAQINIEQGELLKVVFLEHAEQKRHTEGVSQEEQGSSQAEQGAYLFISAHHLAVDAVSWMMLLAQAEALLHSAEAGQKSENKAASVGSQQSYRAYVNAWSQWLETDQAKVHEEYWQTQAKQSIRRLAFNNNEQGVAQRQIEQEQANQAQVGQARSERLQTELLQPLQFQSQLSKEDTHYLLNTLPNVLRTQVDVVLLAALQQALCEWQGDGNSCIELEGHGRQGLLNSVDLSQTVGWFTSIYPVILPAIQGVNTEQHLQNTQAALASIPAKGDSFLGLKYAERNRNTALANFAGDVLFNYLGEMGEQQSAFKQVEFDGLVRANASTHALSLNVAVTNGTLRCDLNADAKQVQASAAEALSRAFQQALTSVIQTAKSKQLHAPLSICYPLASAEEAQLEVWTQGQQVQDIYPATGMQQGLLFHSMMESGSYITQMRMTFSGLDIARFEQAWQQLIQRYDVFRTGFVGLDDAVAHQRVMAQANVPFSVVDLSDLDESAQSEQLDSFAQTDKAQPFDLANPPLMRLTCFVLGEQQTVFWSYHHALIDGWCQSILFNDLLQLYRGENALPAPLQYRVYADWLAQKSVQKAESYWQSQLAMLTEQTPLPQVHKKKSTLATDALTADSQETDSLNTLQGNSEHTVTLSESASLKVAHLAEKSHVSVNAIVRGAWSLMLARYADVERVRFGAISAGRPNDIDGVESIVGLFINCLPITVSLPEEQPVCQWLRSINNDIVEQENFNYLPLSAIQKLHNDSSLFDSILVFENFPVDDDLVQGINDDALTIESIKTREGTNYDITVIAQYDDRLRFRIETRNAVYQQSAAKAFADGLAHVLDSMTRARTVADIGLVSNAQIHAIQAQQQRNAVAYDDERLIHEWIEEVAASSPNNIAVYDEQSHLTYDALNQQANQLAHYLRSQGVKANDLVTVCLPPSVQTMVAILAVLKAGAGYVPFDPEYPQSRMGVMLQVSTPKFVLKQQHCEIEAATAEQLINLDETSVLQSVQQQSTGNLARLASQNPDNLIYLIFTSGSTGTPKGATVRHRNETNLLHWYQDKYDFNAQSRALIVSSVGFDLTQKNLFAPLVSGGAVCFIADKYFSAEKAQTLIQQWQVSHINCAPSTMYHLTEKGENWPNVNWILLGGEAIDSGWINRWIAAGDARPGLVNMYGPSECTDISCDFVLTPDYWQQHQVTPIGEAMANVNLYVLDSAYRLMPEGAIGELWVGGLSVGLGYYGQPELTAERFVDVSLFDGHQERIYRTGDLVRQLPDGNIEFIGRKDDQVKIRGFRIELGEIEFQLSQHDFVQSSVAVAREDVPGQKQLVAYVVAKPQSAESVEGVATSNSSSEVSNEAGVNSEQGSTTAQAQTNATSAQDSVSTPIHAESELTKTSAEKALPSAATQAEQIQQLKASLQENLPDYMVPAAIMVLDSLPLTANGKVDKKQLPMPDWAGLAEASYVAAESQTEAKLVELWAGLLNLTAERLSVEANFFELGGDSILSIQLVSKAAKAGLQFGVKDLFEARTIRRLAKHIDKQDGMESTILAPQEAVTGLQPLLPIQNEFFEDEADLSHFNQSLLLTIPKDLDLPLLQAMVHKLYERHDALRLVFGKVGNTAQSYSNASVVGKNDLGENGVENSAKSGVLGQCWQGEYRDIEQLAVSELVTEIDWADVNSEFETASNSGFLNSDANSANSGSINVDKNSSNKTQKTNAFGQWATSIQQSLDIENGALMRAVIVRNVDVESADGQELSNVAIEKSAGENSSSNESSSTNSNSSTDRLFLVIHHLVVDGVSWRVLLQDLAALYEQHQQKQALELDAKTSSYQQWGAFLAEFSQSDEVQSQVEYWQQVVETPVAKWSELETNRAGVDTSEEATSKQPLASQEAQFGELTFSLNEATTQQLLSESNQAYRTRINELLLSGLLLGMQQWQGLNAIRIDLESHGREALNDALDLSETLGWFTSIYPCLLSVDESGLGADLGVNISSNLSTKSGTGLDEKRNSSAAISANIANLICSVKEQYRGIPTGGLGYGLLSRASVVDGFEDQNRELLNQQHSSENNAQPSLETPENASQNAANHNPISASHSELLFNYLGQFDASTGEGQVFTRASESTGQGVSLKRAQMHGLSLNGYVENGQLHIGLGFDKTRYSESFLQDWMQAYESGLSTIVAHCRQVVEGELSSKFTPSDFPLATMNQASLDAWQNDFVEASVQADAVAKNEDVNHASLQNANAQNAIQDIYPATGMQQGMLFHSLLASDSYATQVKVGFSGLHGAHFKAAWEQVIARHDIFRTRFVGLEEGQAHQLVQRHAELEWHELDLTHLAHDKDAQNAEVEAYRLADKQRGFDVEHAPLMRLALITLSKGVSSKGNESEDQQILIWTHHHALLDGWCTSLVFGEVTECYRALQTGTAAQLPSVQPYRDYVAWLCAQSVESAQDYWRQSLESVEGKNALPLMKQDAPSTQSVGGHQARLSLDEEQTQALVQLARVNKTTVNVLVQAAWSLLLSRYNGDSSIVFGVTTSGRPADLEGVNEMVGLFINTLPMKINVNDDLEIGPWLSDIHSTLIEADSYSYLPLADIQQVAPTSSLFDSLLIFENYPVDAAISDNAERAALTVTELFSDEQTNYALCTTANLTSQLHLILDGQMADYDANTIRLLVAQLAQVLTNMLASERVGEVSVLSKAQEVQTVAALQGPILDYSEERALPHRILDFAESTPDAIALIEGEQQITYAELAARVQHIHQEFTPYPGEVIGVLMPRCLDWAVSFVAVTSSGGIYVPLNPDLPEERLQAIVDESGLTRVITRMEYQPIVCALAVESVVLDPSNNAVSLPNQGALVKPEVALSDTAYCIFTSGTTGKPKGVMISHEAMLSMYCAWREAYQLETHARRHLQMAECSFDVSIGDMIRALGSGGTLVICDKPTLLEPAALLSLIDQHQVQIAEFVPMVLRGLVDLLIAQSRQLSSMRFLIVGSDAWNLNDHRKAETVIGEEATLVNSYGLTECTIDSTYFVRESIFSGGEEAQGTVACIGKPFANVCLFVLNDRLQIVPTGAIGELCVGGVTVAQGYLNRPELTAERFVDVSLFDGHQERIYRTGDLVRQLPDGNIEFIGRKDDQVKIRGFRIELGEIEFQLSQHEFVQSSVAVAREDVPGQKQLVAYVVAKPQSAESVEGVATSNSSSEISASAQTELTQTQAEQALPSAATQAEQIQQLKASLQENLPDYMVPAAIMVLDALPLTANGKVDKKQLPMPDWAGLAEASYVAAESQTEAKLVALWANLLNLTPERLSVEANFFELGGDSILSIQLVSKAAKAGLQFGVKDLFEARTIRRLAKHIDKQDGTESTILAPQEAITGQQPLLPIQNEFFEDEADLSHFNQSLLLTIPKDLDLPLLQAMVHKLYERHDALRLVFGKVGNTAQSCSNASVVSKNDFGENGVENSAKPGVAEDASSEARIKSGELGQCWQGEYRDIEQLTVSELVTEIDWAAVNSEFETTSSSSSLKSDKTSSNSGSINVDKTSSNQTQKTNAFGQWATSIQQSLDIENGALMRAVIVRNVNVESADGQELSNVAIEKSAGENPSSNESSNLNETQNSSTNSNSSTDRLFLVIHHLVVDGVSWRVLLQDLAALYEQHQQNQVLELDAKTSSYQQWGTFLVEFAQSDDIQSQVEYWQQVVETPVAKWSELEANRAGADTSLDVSLKQSLASQEVQFGELTFSLNESTTQQLLSESNQAYRTRINELLLSGLLLGMQQWQGLNAIRIDLESHGREALNDALDLSETLGWFTSIYPCLLSVNESGLGADLSAKSDVNSNAGAANIANLICSVKEQYRGIPTGGLGYGLLSRASVVDDALNTESQPQINPISASHSELLFNYLGQFDASTGEGQVFTRASESTGQGVSLKRAQMHGLSLNGYVENGQLHIGLGFDKTRYSESFLQDWMQAYESGLSAIVAHCQQVIDGELSSKFTPSDFPLATMNQASLDAWQSDFVEASVQADAVANNEDASHASIQNAIQDIYPATGMQQGMLFHSLLASDSYATQVKVGFSGLHGAHFKAAWEQVIARHDIFRTRFVGLEEGQAHQLVQRHAELEWSELDLTHLAHDKDAQNAEIEAYRLADKQRGFDVERAPLMRLALITLSKGVSSNHESEDQQVLIWTHHHALLDGWCTSLVFGEVTECYRALQTGTAAQLPSVQPYRGYVEWIAQRTESEAETFWQNWLSDVEGVTPLPLVNSASQALEHAQPEVLQTSLSLSPQNTAKLVELARRHHTTVNVLLQAAWSLLLSRYSGESCVVFGVTTSGRPADLDGVNDMVGLFINTIPMKVNVDETVPLSDWLGQIHRDLISADSHSYTPLSDIQRVGAAGQSLFDTLVVFENYPVDATIEGNAERAALNVTSVDNFEGNNYSLSLVAHLGEQLELTFKMQDGLFTQAQVAQLQQHLSQLLSHLGHGEQQLANIPMLQTRELESLRAPLEGENLRYPEQDLLHEQLAHMAIKQPHHPALVCGEESITYEALDIQSTRLAHVLQKRGIGSNTNIAICMPRSIEMIVAMLAVWKTGNAYVPLDQENPLERLAFIVKDTQSPCVLVAKNADFEAFHAHSPNTWVMPVDLAQLNTLEADDTPISSIELDTSKALPAQRAAYVIYTSGSTGQPKGVRVTHDNLNNYCHSIMGLMPQPSARSLVVAKLNFDLGLTGLYPALLQGVTCELIPQSDDDFVAYADTIFAAQESLLLKMTPSQANTLVALAQGQQWSHPHHIFVGGEAFSTSVLKQLQHTFPQATVFNHYGPSETTIGCIAQAVTLNDTVNDAVILGRPLGNTALSILGKNNQPVPKGAIGELCIAGRGVSLGYLNRDELTQQQFVNTHGTRMYRTGDLVKLDDKGLVFVGRADAQIKLRGFRIELGEIESKVAQLAYIDKAVVQVHNDALIAHVTAASQALLEGQELLTKINDDLSRDLPHYMLLSAVQLESEMPLTGNGKINRKLLTLPSLPTEQVIPLESDTQIALAQVWATLLNLSESVISPSTNFLALGGHSLLLIQLRARIEQQFNYPISLADVYEHLTLKDMAALIEVAALKRALTEESTTQDAAEADDWEMTI